jgi:hypothetical protein
MTFEEILDQAVAMLQRRGRVAFRALKRQFDVDDGYLEDLKETICYEYPEVVEDGQGLVWHQTQETADIPQPDAPLTPQSDKPELLSYISRNT